MAHCSVGRTFLKALLNVSVYTARIILELKGAPIGDSRDLSLKVSMMAPGEAPCLRLGISMDQLTPQIARQRGLPVQTTGVVVI